MRVRKGGTSALAAERAIHQEVTQGRVSKPLVITATDKRDAMHQLRRMGFSDMHYKGADDSRHTPAHMPLDFTLLLSVNRILPDNTPRPIALVERFPGLTTASVTSKVHATPLSVKFEKARRSGNPALISECEANVEEAARLILVVHRQGLYLGDPIPENLLVTTRGQKITFVDQTSQNVPNEGPLSELSVKRGQTRDLYVIEHSLRKTLEEIRRNAA